MFLAERKTDSRGRPPARDFSRERVRRVRRSVGVRCLTDIACDLLLLAFLAAHELAGVADALAFVGLRRAHAADAGGGLADQLLVDAADADLGLPRRRERDAGRRRHVDLVRVAELHRQRLALHLRAVAHADQLQRGLVALGHAVDHVGDQAAREAPHRPRALAFVAWREGERAVLVLDPNLVGDGPGQLALGALDRDGVPVERNRDAGWDRDRFLADAGHGDQYTRQRTSPPTLASRAALSDMTPLGVERIEMPRPFFTGLRSRIEEYTRRPGFDTRAMTAMTGSPSKYFSSISKAGNSPAFSTSV